MRKIALASLISALTIFLVVCMCLAQIVAEPDSEGGAGGRGDAHLVDPHAGFWEATSATSSFVFAMAGQKIYLEMMAEMRDPSEFPKALYAATPIMFLSYTAVSLTGYAIRGDQAPLYLMDVLSAGSAPKTFASLLMLVHMMISYTLNSQVLCRRIHRLVDPVLVDVHDPNHPRYKEARTQWAKISGSVMFAAWTLSNSIPFFSDFIELIGSLCSAPLALGLPALFYWEACRRNFVRMSVNEARLLWTFGAASVALIVFGTVAALRDFVHHSKEYGAPFDCFCEAESCNAKVNNGV
jgi:amino acid permease